MATRIRLAAATLVLLVAGPAHAGWEHSHNGIGQDAGYFDISVPDAENAYVVGVQDTGTGSTEAVVMVTHDGGGSWTAHKPSPSPIAFYVSVFAPTGQRAYAGAMGTVWITTTGGASWNASGDAGLNPIHGLGGYGESLVLASAADGRILRSDSGGASWTDVTNPLGSEGITGFTFIDATTGWGRAGSRDEDSGVYSGGGLIRTTDGGQTWETLFSGEPRTIAAVSFIDAEHGWLVSNSATSRTVERTTDGGTTWTPLSLPSYTMGSVEQVWDVDFFDRCEGWLIASTGTEQVTSGFFYTTDGGESWTEIDMAWTAIDTPLPIPVRGNPIVFDFAGRESGFCGGYFEFLGTYSADAPQPDCTEPDPADPSWEDEGCGCTIVW
jgi:photosystem II stability/assembly factor-like uncharacterized protein